MRLRKLMLRNSTLMYMYYLRMNELIDGNSCSDTSHNSVLNYNTGSTEYRNAVMPVMHKQCLLYTHTNILIIV